MASNPAVNFNSKIMSVFKNVKEAIETFVRDRTNRNNTIIRLGQEINFYENVPTGLSEEVYDGLIRMRVIPTMLQLLNAIGAELSQVNTDPSPPTEQESAGNAAPPAAPSAATESFVVNADRYRSTMKSLAEALEKMDIQGANQLHRNFNRTTQSTGAGGGNQPVIGTSKEDLQKVHRTLLRMVSDLQARYRSANQAVSRDALEGMKRTIKFLEGIITKVRRESKEAIEAARAESAAAEAARVAASNALSALEQQVVEMRTQQEAAAAQAVEAAAEEQRDLAQRIREATAALQAAQTEHANKIQQLELIAREAGERLVGELKAKNNVTKQVAKLQSNLERARQELENAKAANNQVIEQLRGELTRLQDQWTAANERAAAAEKTAAEQQTTLQALGARIKELEAIQKNLTSGASESAQQHAERIGELQADLSQLTAALNRMMMMYNELKASYSAINNMSYLTELSSVEGKTALTPEEQSALKNLIRRSEASQVMTTLENPALVQELSTETRALYSSIANKLGITSAPPAGAGMGGGAKRSTRRPRPSSRSSSRKPTRSSKSVSPRKPSSKKASTKPSTKKLSTNSSTKKPSTKKPSTEKKPSTKKSTKKTSTKKRSTKKMDTKSTKKSTRK